MEMAHQPSLAPVLDRLPLAWFAALLSVGAAGVHFAVAPEHFAEYWFFGWFFVVVAWLQAVWAVVLTSRPSRGVFISAIVGNLVLAGIWLWTRVVSLPIGPNAGHAEAVGWSDTLTVVLQAGVVGLCLLSSGRTTRRPELSGVLVLVLGSLALIAATGFALSADADRSGGTEPSTHHP